jgi:hypothetical protein
MNAKPTTTTKNSTSWNTLGVQSFKEMMIQALPFPRIGMVEHLRPGTGIDPTREPKNLCKEYEVAVQWAHQANRKFPNGTLPGRE